MGIKSLSQLKEGPKLSLNNLRGVPGEWFLLYLIIMELSASNYSIYKDEIAITGYGVAAPLRELYQRLCQTELDEKDWFRKNFVASEGLARISKSILAVKDKVVDMDIPEDYHIILEKIFENCSLINAIDETESNILEYGVMDSEQYIVNCILEKYLPLISDYVTPIGGEEDSPDYLRIPKGGVSIQDGYGMVAFYLLAIISKHRESVSIVNCNQKVVAVSSSNIVGQYTDSLFNWSEYYSQGLVNYCHSTAKHFVSYDNSVDDDIKIEMEKLLQRSCFDSFTFRDTREKYKSCEFGSLMNPDNVYEYLYSIEDKDKLNRLLAGVVNEIHFLRRNKSFYISSYLDKDSMDYLGDEIVSFVNYWQSFATRASKQFVEDNTIGGRLYDDGFGSIIKILDLGLEYLYPLEGIDIRKAFDNNRFDADMMKSMVESAVCDDISLKEMICETLDDLDIVNMRNPGRENMNALNGNTYVETAGVGDD